MFYETRFTFTQFEVAPVFAGVNCLTSSYKPAGPDDRAVVTPNATTLFSAGFLDLSEEPLVVELPGITDHYAIGDRDELAFNEDDSLTLYVQRESPGKDKESN